MNTEVTKTQNHAAGIVQTLGKITLSNGVSIKESMLVSGISLWEVAEPTIALHIVPFLLKSDSGNLGLKDRLVLYIKWFRQKARNFSFLTSSEDNSIRSERKSKWFFLVFSEYMYRDVLKPVIECIHRTSEEFEPIIIRSSTGIVQGKESFSVFRYRKKSNYLDFQKLKYSIRKVVKDFKGKGLDDVYVQQNDLSKQQLDYLFKWLFLVFIPQFIPVLVVAQRLFGTGKPQIIITCNIADPRSRIYCLFGRNYGIPILELQFGHYGTDSVEWRFTLADKVATWGEHFERLLANFYGIPRHKLESIGSPRFDYIKTISKESFLKLCKENKMFAEGNKLILFASSYTIPGYDQVFSPDILNSFKERLFEISGGIDNLILLVKPHPVENPQRMKDAAHRYKNIFFIDPLHDIREYIPFCDGFITLGSTATYDALLADKVIISPNMKNLVWWEDIFIEQNVSICVNDYEQLEHVFLDMVANDTKNLSLIKNNVKEFIKEAIHKPDGKASERVVQLARNMINVSV